MTPYELGRKSFLAGEQRDRCPLPRRKKCVRGALERVQWWNGYLDARTDELLGDIFRSWGVSTMYEDRQTE